MRQSSYNGWVWRYNDLELDSRAMLTVALGFAGRRWVPFEQGAGPGAIIVLLPCLRFPAFRSSALASGGCAYLDFQNLGIGRRLGAGAA